MTARAIYLPWLLLAAVASVLVYVLIDRSVVIDHQGSDLKRLGEQTKALSLLLQKELVGSEYARVRSAIIEVSKAQRQTDSVLEKAGNLHFHGFVFQFYRGKLTAIREINEFESKP